MNASLNLHGVKAIYLFEINRFRRTLMQSLLAPVVSTTLYFVVFGAAIGGRIETVDGIAYAAFIVPGLIMLAVITESLSNASFGIFLPKFQGTIYEVLSAPISPIEIVIGYVGAAATKSILLGCLIMITARIFVDYTILHPLWTAAYLVLTCVTFSLFGFILGLWADNFQRLQMVPLLVVTPLAFLGGTFYSITMLPEPWDTVALLNPVLYLVSGFRWSFYGMADVAPAVSLGMTFLFLLVCLAVVTLIFRTGWRLKP